MNRPILLVAAAAASLLAGYFAFAGGPAGETSASISTTARLNSPGERGTSIDATSVQFGQGRALSLFLVNNFGSAVIRHHNGSEGLLASRMRISSDGAGFGAARLNYDGSANSVAYLLLPSGAPTVEISFDPPIPIESKWSTTILSDGGAIIVEYTGTALPSKDALGDTMVVR